MLKAAGDYNSCSHCGRAAKKLPRKKFLHVQRILCSECYSKMSSTYYEKSDHSWETLGNRSLLPIS